MRSHVYFDHIAASPLLPEVREAMLPFLMEEFGNPQSRHVYGRRPRAALVRAREQVAALIGTEPEEVFFSASGSESNNLAVKGVARAYEGRGRHLVASVLEHQSVLNPLRTLERQGYSISWVPVDAEGRVNPEKVAEVIREDTILVSVMLANNEIGTVEPIAEIGRLTRDREIPFHTDAVAAVGLLPVDVDTLGVDLLSLAAPTFYGPKGAAALYVRRGTRIRPLIEGGIQEEGRRSGTENVPAIVGMGAAAAIASKELPLRRAHLDALQHRMREGLGRTPHLFMTGDPRNRLPSIVSLCVGYIDGEALIRNLDDAGICAASGSSCSSYALKISPVLTAMGIPANLAQGAVVFSLGMGNTVEEVDLLLDRFPECVERLRAVSPVYAELRRKGPGAW